MIITPSELALINFNGLVRTTDIFRAALQELQHGFRAEHAPVCDSTITQAIFCMDFKGGFAAHDVVRDK